MAGYLMQQGLSGMLNDHNFYQLLGMLGSQISSGVPLGQALGGTGVSAINQMSAQQNSAELLKQILGGGLVPTATKGDGNPETIKIENTPEGSKLIVESSKTSAYGDPALSEPYYSQSVPLEAQTTTPSIVPPKTSNTSAATSPLFKALTEVDDR